MDNFCCINTNEILENTNFGKFSTSNNKEYREDSYSMLTSPASELKSLPLMEMKTGNMKTPKSKIKSLSNLPISTKNVIRKISGDPYENYRILKKLGQGTFGQVYKIIQLKTGNIRALKIIPKNNLRSGFTDKDIIREINIMKNLDHPHIIKLYEFYKDEENYYLVNEFCTEGDLSEKMQKLKFLPEPIVKILMAQIFSAVFYLNNRGIIHGDLKLENILVDSYLDDGNIQTQKPSNFISSLIKDATNVRNYLRDIKLKKGNTAIFNRQKLNESLKKYRISGKGLYHKNKDKIHLYANPNNIINEETKECEFNNEERKDNYDFDKNNEERKNNFELDKNNEDTNIFGFESNDENEIGEIHNKDSSDFSSSPEKDNSNQVSPFELEEHNNLKIKSKLSKSSLINWELEKNEEKQSKSDIRNIERKLTYNYNKLNIKNFELKLIDFGCSKIFSPYKKITFEDTIGTLVYCSPEVLKNKYDQKCDIWSCGVIMYLLLCGKFPFSGKTEEEITKKILFGKLKFNNKQFENISESAKDLISKCLIRDKNKRITIKEAMKHEFFAGEIDINNIFEDEVITKNVLNNLKINSRQTSKFYQIVLTYLSYNFADKEHLQKLRNIFYKIDSNMDGKLSKEELYNAYKDAGIDITKKEINKIIEFMDFDGNGYIEYEEFIRVTLPKEQLFTDINLKNAFDMFDKDKNGTISMDEIIEIIGIDKELDKNAIEELKKEVSYDGDKEIDFKHFKDFMFGLKNEN